MEFARCLMLSSIKRRHMGDSSWEEKAFAEDAAGVVLGGIVWPPRSYSCSFCHREFRSAQALGGHMNVHRRDRARLKQSLIIPTPNPNFPRVSPAVDPKKDGIDEKKYIPSSLCHKGPSDCPSNSSDVIERMSKEQNSTMSSKRSKTSGSNSLSSFRLGPYSSTHNCSIQSDAVGLRLTSVEELDLELRLGDTPRVK